MLSPVCPIANELYDYDSRHSGREQARSGLRLKAIAKVGGLSYRDKEIGDRGVVVLVEDGDPN